MGFHDFPASTWKSGTRVPSSERASWRPRVQVESDRSGATELALRAENRNAAWVAEENARLRAELAALEQETQVKLGDHWAAWLKRPWHTFKTI